MGGHRPPGLRCRGSSYPQGEPPGFRRKQSFASANDPARSDNENALDLPAANCVRSERRAANDRPYDANPIIPACRDDGLLLEFVFCLESVRNLCIFRIHRLQACGEFSSVPGNSHGFQKFRKNLRLLSQDCTLSFRRSNKC